MRESKLVIKTETKTFHFDSIKDTGINLKREIYSAIKRYNICKI